MLTLVLGLALFGGSVVTGATPQAPATNVRLTPQAYVAPIVPRVANGMHNAGLQASSVAPCPKGVGSIRLWDNDTSWTRLQPKPVAPNFTALDHALAAARACGVRDVLLVIGSTPAWAARSRVAGDYPAPGSASMVSYVKYWRAWVSLVVSHSKLKTAGAIQMQYQIWNEANLPMMWRGSAADMALLTALAYPIIKRIDPHALVVAASTTLRLSNYRTWYSSYLANLAKYRWPVDVFSFHGYPASSGTPLTRDASILAFKSVLMASRAPTRPIWDTELNYGLRGPAATNTYRPITGALAAAYVAQTMLDSLRLGVARTYWYSWAPTNTLLGIQFQANTPGALALATVSGWLAGRAWYGCIGPVASGLINCRSGIAQIMWSTRSPVTVRVPAGVTKLIDPRGIISLVRAGQSVRIGVLPIWFGH